MLDLVLVGTRIHNKDDGVLLLDLLHGRLSLQRILDDVKVRLVRRHDPSAVRERKLGVLRQAQSARAMEMHVGANARNTLPLLALYRVDGVNELVRTESTQNTQPQ